MSGWLVLTLAAVAVASSMATRAAAHINADLDNLTFDVHETCLNSNCVARVGWTYCRDCGQPVMTVRAP